MDGLFHSRVGPAAVALAIATLAASYALPSRLPERARWIARLSEGRVDWVRTDGRWVAYGSGVQSTLAEAGPPFAVRFALSLDEPVTDALLAGRRLILVVGGRRLGLVDIESPATSVAFVKLAPPPRSELRLSLGGRWLLVTENGLGTRVFRMEPLHGAGHHHDEGGQAPGLTRVGLLPAGPAPRAREASAWAGRLIYVAGGDEGLLLYRDETAGSQIHSVNVLNDFYSPQQITIEVGDTVKWTNAAGFHNVRSCFPGQNGCDGVMATETFASGPPSDPLWGYDHTFQLPGPNPYICQSHAPFMTGLVEVNATTPPGVPDGTVGTPLTVAKLDPGGTVLSVAWDAATCSGAFDHQILYGLHDLLPDTPGGTYQLSGSECSIGTTSPFAWNLPSGLQDAGQLVWWVVVTTNGQNREGAWGADSQDNERSGPGPFGSSGECGIGAKDLSNPCGQ